MFITTEPITDKDTLLYMSSLNIDISVIYGVPETTGVISILTPFMNKKNSIGLPIMDIKIDNNKILVKGENMSQGYYNKKKLKKWFDTQLVGKIIDEFLYKN
jgi:long-subunit acyl-CoA synthetase (AMP-forming)